MAEWNRRWSKLLRRAVQPQTGLVRYKVFRERSEELAKLIDALAEPRSFDSDAQRLALLLNAYNAFVIDAVLAELPVSSVRQIDGFFSRIEHKLLGRSVTLEGLRDRWIRPISDARVHMALVPGAAGGPPLRRRAYRAKPPTPSGTESAGLDAQLDAQARRFVSDRRYNGRLADRALLSPLLKWFRPDFREEPFGGVIPFLRQHAATDSPIGRLLGENPDPPITYLDFNWALNNAP